MKLSNSRDCPLCGARPKRLSFPYATFFNSIQFCYLKCSTCKSVFVDPLPDEQTFAQMYAKSSYHDCYYDGTDGADYEDSARLLRKYLEPSSTVLDYGCGMGSFLRACRSQGLEPVGVEFDQDTAKFAASNANCQVLTVQAFSKLSTRFAFDAIHLGDVLEHLPKPMETLALLLKFLKPGGVLFVEGPIEENPSLVLWAVKIFGQLKHFLKPKFMPNDPPTHLFRTNAHSQKAFLMRVNQGLTMCHWQIYETGWPYKSGGVIKSYIAKSAIFLSGRHIKDMTYGNRFKALMLKD